PATLLVADNPDFGHDVHIVVREERLPDDLVGGERAVGVGRVDVVDAQLDCGTQQLDRGGAVARRPEDAGAGELHRAVADPVEVEVPDPVGAGLRGGLLYGGHGFAFRTRVNLFANATCDRRSAEGPNSSFTRSAARSPGRPGRVLPRMAPVRVRGGPVSRRRGRDG